MMNKQNGNMYGWVNFTWNPIKGICPHQCVYCYMKKYWDKLGEPRLDEKCSKDNLGENNFIFVGSSIDMFADNIPTHWIDWVLNYCSDFNNKYLFQTKNPIRFHELISMIPKNSILGTTIETNYYNIVETSYLTKAPLPEDRSYQLSLIKDFKKMVSIEPIMDFNLIKLVEMIKLVQPEFVSIGADSKKNNLDEPNKEKTEQLINELKKFTEVRIKNNLKRLI